MNILAIGNSFSEDATRYLHQIARADGIEINVASLYIGGCSLERHFRNMMSGKEVYELIYNGDRTGFNVSLDEALLNRKWDYITLQQSSAQSVNYETYQPYLNELCLHIRKLSPNTKILMHQTWAYETGSEKLISMEKFADYSQMFEYIKENYDKAAKDINADFIIKSGELMQKLISANIKKVHRDGFHLSLGTGRYAASLLWYALVSKNNVENNTFCDFDEEVTQQEISIVKKCVNEVIVR